MSRAVGLYYWRGRVLTLLVTVSGQYAVRVPDELRSLWRRDVAAGKVRHP